MANTLGVYNPIFYAQEALIQLEKSLGMASRVHMGFDEERRGFGKGETISMRRPSTFSVASAPATAADITTETITLTLDQWNEVKFKLTDKELAFTGERIISDHIRPAAYSLADEIDSDLCNLFKDVPWLYALEAAPGSNVSDITGPRKILFDNSAMMSNDMHFMVNSEMESELLQLPAFAQHQGAGEFGVDTQRRGFIGQKYGFEMFANQNVKAHTSGTASDVAGTVNGTVAIGGTTISVDALGTGTLVPGDTFSIAGNSQEYAITNTTTASANENAGITFTPQLVAAATDGAVVTLVATDSVAECLAFHRKAFGLVMAPLSDRASELGAKVATVQDPVTGISLRARMYYVGNSSEVHVALDTLYGVKTLDPNLAVRAQDDA